MNGQDVLRGFLGDDVKRPRCPARRRNKWGWVAASCSFHRWHENDHRDVHTGATWKGDGTAPAPARTRGDTMATGDGTRARRTVVTRRTTTVELVACPMGPRRENGPHLADLREFVEACAGLPGDVRVHITNGPLSESGARDVVFRAVVDERVEP